jgi:hypothetical protein
MDNATTLITKGILGDVASLATKGYILLKIEQGPVTSAGNRSGGGANGEYYIPAHTDPPGPKKKWVRVTFQYNDKVYRDLKYVDENVSVTSDNIEIEVIDDMPTVKIIL